jgi:hypothetical protein
MRLERWFPLFLVALLLPSLGHAEDLTGKIKKAAERCTLDQAGTHPFRLKAELAPSFERDKDSGRTGEVEIWWQSPTQWKRELRSPGFHQIEIVNGGQDWQKNEGDYFPEWLQKIAVQLVNPLPALDEILGQVKDADVRRMSGKTKTGEITEQTSLSWIKTTGTAEVRNIQRYSVALDGSSGLLNYTYGFGWGAEFQDYKGFHDLKVARTVKVGSTEVTAKVTTLEDLGDVPASFLDAGAGGGDRQSLRTEYIDEPTLRKNLLPAEPIIWPPVKDGPLQGNVTTWIVVDREGKVRDIDSMVSENPAMSDTGKAAVTNLRFKPFVVNGVPVQVMSQITTPFKTTRPAGVETFDSAETFFERGRKLGFPAADDGKPYILRAEFQLRNKAGEIETGKYEDTWLSDTQWRREAWFEDGHCVRSRDGEKRYRLVEGGQGNLVQTILQLMEPIPAIDTFTESDWRIKRDTVNGLQTIRVARGPESSDGKLDPAHSSGLWFDQAGSLVKTASGPLETQRSDFQGFNAVKIARQIDVLMNGSLAMRIRVTDVEPAGAVPAATFALPGHEWERQFTSEVR